MKAATLTRMPKLKQIEARTPASNCPSNFQFYQCAASSNGASAWSGCCSVDPCGKGPCPAANQFPSPGTVVSSTVSVSAVISSTTSSSNGQVASTVTLPPSSTVTVTTPSSPSSSAQTSTSISSSSSSSMSMGTGGYLTTMVMPTSSTATSSSSPSSIAITSKSSSEGHSFPIAPLVGGMVGGVVLLAVLVALLLLCCKRRKAKQEQKKSLQRHSTSRGSRPLSEIHSKYANSFGGEHHWKPTVMEKSLPILTRNPQGFFNNNSQDKGVVSPAESDLTSLGGPNVLANDSNKHTKSPVSPEADITSFHTYQATSSTPQQWHSPESITAPESVHTAPYRPYRPPGLSINLAEAQRVQLAPQMLDSQPLNVRHEMEGTPVTPQDIDKRHELPSPPMPSLPIPPVGLLHSGELSHAAEGLNRNKSAAASSTYSIPIAFTPGTHYPPMPSQGDASQNDDSRSKDSQRGYSWIEYGDSPTVPEVEREWTPARQEWAPAPLNVNGVGNATK
jgi:hypothetical protein